MFRKLDKDDRQFRGRAALEAEIANTRPEIDWSQGRLDFIFVMSPGLIEQAPHTERLMFGNQPSAAGRG